MKLLFSQYVHALSDAVIASNEECADGQINAPHKSVSAWWPLFFNATTVNSASFKAPHESADSSTRREQRKIGYAAGANKKSPKKTITAQHTCAAVENLTEPDPEFTRALAALEKIVGRAKASVSMTQTVLAKVLETDEIPV